MSTSSTLAHLKALASLNSGCYFSVAELEELLVLSVEVRERTASRSLYNLATDVINRLVPAANLEPLRSQADDK